MSLATTSWETPRAAADHALKGMHCAVSWSASRLDCPFLLGFPLLLASLLFPSFITCALALHCGCFLCFCFYVAFPTFITRYVPLFSQNSRSLLPSQNTRCLCTVPALLHLRCLVFLFLPPWSDLRSDSSASLLSS